MDYNLKMSPYAHFKGRAMFRHILVKLSRSKYRAHVGAKERARHAGRISLGPNASRALKV